MANDHYVSRMLTAPWEFGERQLCVFDFVTRAFTDQPSKTLFARPGLNSNNLEKWLNRVIETPLGGLTSRLRAGARLFAPKDWSTQRALALLFLLNGRRIGEGRWGDKEAITLEEVATKGEAFADAVARFYLGRAKLLRAQVPRGRELFFTEAVTFAYPMPERPINCIPLGLGHLVLSYDGPLEPAKLKACVDLDLLASFSLGLGTNVHRVILPPECRLAKEKNVAEVRANLMELRADLCELFDQVGKASAMVGLTGWEVTK